VIWDNVVDTALNVIVFAFIGALIWLYLRDEDSAGSPTDQGLPGGNS